MKKKISFFICGILAMSLCCGSTVMAEEINDKQAETVVVQPEKLTGFDAVPETGVEIGESQTFKSVDDNSAAKMVPAKTYKSGDLIYSKDLAINSGIVQKDRAYFNSKSNLSQVFVKYLTSSWAKASSYSWSKSNSASWSVSGNVELSISRSVVSKMGLSTSRTTSYATTVTIPASANKYSKLGFASDYTKLVYTHKRYNNDTLLYSKTETVKTPNVNTYLIIYYK